MYSKIRGRGGDMAHSSNGEIKRLQKLRTQLKNTIMVIEAEQETLEEEIRPIRQKVAILELKKSVRRRRDELAGLPIKKRETRR
jgi:hypothetical protein